MIKLDKPKPKLLIKVDRFPDLEVYQDGGQIYRKVDDALLYDAGDLNSHDIEAAQHVREDFVNLLPVTFRNGSCKVIWNW